MIPVRLELKNFLAYRAPDPLRFDGIHLACLTGANGAGKSSLLDAITWAVWGEARTKRDDALVHTGQSDMQVQLDFLHEGTVYRVLRRRSSKGRGTTTLDLFSLLEGELNLLSEGSIRATQEKINYLLRLDYETFVHSAFLQQGRADAFTTKPPNQRKQILADILGLAQWEQYEEAAKAELKRISSELDVIEHRLRDITQELAKEPRLKADLDEAATAQREAQSALTQAEALLAEVAAAPVQMKAAQEKLADTERRRREWQRDLQALTGDLNRQQQRIQTFEAVLQQEADIAAGYQALQAAREADSALAEKLIQLRDFDTLHRDLENQLRDARGELETEASAEQAQIQELERTLSQADADALSSIQNEVAALHITESERTHTQTDLAQLGEERAGLESLLKTLGEEGKSLRGRMEQLSSTDSVTCPLCGQPLDEAHRSQLIAQLEAEIVQMRTEYAQRQERIRQIGEETTHGKAHLTVLETTLRQLAPLLEKQGALQLQMDSALEAELRVQEARARWEAIQHLLTEERYALELREQLAALEAQRAEIGYDRGTHDAARDQLKAYQGYEARQKELEVAQQTLPDLRQALDGLHLRQERTQKALLETDTELAHIQAEITQLEVLVKEQQTRQQEVNRLHSFERQQYNRLVAAQQELKALEDQRGRKAELEVRQGQKRHEHSLYDDLRKAFGKNGVPAMIIEAAIPELEDSANTLLTRMTDGRMNLRFTTQREKISSEGVIETLDIEIADELGTRSYELYSGGEAFRINFAVRVALSQLLARRAGAQLRTLFIDEGFGTQDEDGRNKLVEAITAIQEQFDLILVITHIDDLRDSFPVHVVVQKTPSGSSISVR
jgi:DNA repair protein SbcC/Rad50